MLKGKICPRLLQSSNSRWEHSCGYTTFNTKSFVSLFMISIEEETKMAEWTGEMFLHFWLNRVTYYTDEMFVGCVRVQQYVTRFPFTIHPCTFWGMMKNVGGRYKQLILSRIMFLMIRRIFLARWNCGLRFLDPPQSSLTLELVANSNGYGSHL